MPTSEMVENWVAAVVERNLPQMSHHVRGKELFSAHDRLRDSVTFHLRGPTGRSAPVLFVVGNEVNFRERSTDHVLAAVEHAAWVLDLPNDLPVVVVGRWRKWGPR